MNLIVLLLKINQSNQQINLEEARANELAVVFFG